MSGTAFLWICIAIAICSGAFWLLISENKSHIALSITSFVIIVVAIVVGVFGSTALDNVNNFAKYNATYKAANASYSEYSKAWCNTIKKRGNPYAYLYAIKYRPEKPTKPKHVKLFTTKALTTDNKFDYWANKHVMKDNKEYLQELQRRQKPGYCDKVCDDTD